MCRGRHIKVMPFRALHASAVEAPESQRPDIVFKLHNFREYHRQFDRGAMNE